MYHNSRRKREDNAEKQLRWGDNYPWLRRTELRAGLGEYKAGGEEDLSEYIC